MKTKDLILTAGSNMLRSKARTILTIIAIFIGSLTLTLTNGIGAGISAYIDRQLGNLGAEDVLMITPAQELAIPGASNQPKKYDPDKTSVNVSGFATPLLKDSDIAKIQKHKGIKNVTSVRITSVDYIQGVNNDKYVVTVTEDIQGTNYDTAAGRAVKVDSEKSEIMLPSTYVKVLGFKSPQDAVGKTVNLGITNGLGESNNYSAEVVGVLNKGIIDVGGATINRKFNQSMYDFKMTGLPEQQKQQFPVAYARFDTKISDTDLTKLKSDLAKQGYSAQTYQDAIGIFRQVINGLIAVLTFFAAIALLAASFGIINTLFMSVQERTKEIGLMKAMGMRSMRIFMLFSMEAILIGFWGSILGILAAMGIGQIANQVVSSTILKDLPGFSLLIFPVTALVQTTLLIMVIAFLAGTLPARRAAKQNPIDALRYE